MHNLLSSASCLFVRFYYWHFVTVIASSLLLLNMAQAQSYPNRPLRFVVGIAAGGGIDIISRAVAAPLSEELGQQVVVDNRPGAGNLLAAKVVAGAPPDGYTLLMGTIASHGITPLLRRDVGYDPIRDFSTLTMVATSANILVVHPSIPAKSMREFISHIRANPGKILYGSPGVGSSIHLSMELFKLHTKTSMVHVPYKGAVVTALLAGEVQAQCGNIAANLPSIRAGKLRALAVTSKARSPHLPDVPTFLEEGLPLEVLVWYAMFSPAGVPNPIISKLNAAIVKVLRSRDVIRRLDELGFDARSSTPEELAAWVRTETTRWREVIRVAGVTVTD
jgi:tripartite-type tricarboxylate transporter receptor subunit TctC